MRCIGFAFRGVYPQPQHASDYYVDTYKSSARLAAVLAIAEPEPRPFPVRPSKAGRWGVGGGQPTPLTGFRRGGPPQDRLPCRANP